MKFLINAGANVNIVEMVGNRTPLHQAASHGDTEIVNLLLRKHANVEIKDKWGKTAKDLAWKDNHREILFLLGGGSRIEWKRRYQ